MAKQKTTQIWLTVNKNGFVSMHNSKPHRNTDTGKWVSKALYVNSLLYKDMVDLAKRADLTWEKEAEPFEINFS